MRPWNESAVPAINYPGRALMHRLHRHLLALTAIAIPFGLLTRRFWFVSDDAYITFRYAQNWAQGYGLRYNLGEHVPVEGYSNFLWVAACAVIEVVGQTWFSGPH